MKNIINSAVHDVNTETIDSLLPFENRGVWIWHVSKKQTGYGHWQLVIDIDIDSDKIILSTVTTNSLMIDYWNGIDENETNMLPTDYIGRVAAITAILENNQSTLIDFIAGQEIREQDALNEDHIGN